MQGIDKTKIEIDGKKLRVGIVRARFNEHITAKMLAATVERLNEHGVLPKNIKVVTVAGSMEIPFALQKLAITKKYDCLVAVGCVIKGETPHFDYVCKMAQEGVLRVSLDNRLPIGFGITTVHNEAQAIARVALGADAATAALELAVVK